MHKVNLLHSLDSVKIHFNAFKMGWILTEFMRQPIICIQAIETSSPAGEKSDLLCMFTAFDFHQIMLVVPEVEGHNKVATEMPFCQTASLQVVVFRLETLGLSQDCIDLEVDHVGDLGVSAGDGDQLEGLLALGVLVEDVHGVFGCFLNII